MPEWVDRTSRHQRKIGFRHAWQRRPVVLAMSCSLIQSPSTSLAVTWHFIGGRVKASAASIPNTIKPAMTSISAGESSRPGGSLVSVPPQLGGTIDAFRLAVSLDTQLLTAK